MVTRPALSTRFCAVTEADRLVTAVMNARGYPVSNFEQRVADISVDHPHVVENYRAAADIARRHRRDEATTEDLRQATVYYRKLFDQAKVEPRRQFHISGWLSMTAQR